MATLDIERVNSAAMAAAGVAVDDCDAWHRIKNAVLRALKREHGIYGPAPQWLFAAACDYADAATGARGWASTFEITGRELATSLAVGE